MATLHELDTVYGLEDLHDLLEILAVEHVNEAAVQRMADMERRQAEAEARRK